jgi:hypothetical protein
VKLDSNLLIEDEAKVNFSQLLHDIMKERMRNQVSDPEELEQVTSAAFSTVAQDLKLRLLKLFHDSTSKAEDRRGQTRV